MLKIRRKEAGRRGQPAHRTKHRGDAPGSRTVCRQGLRPDLRMVGRPAILFRTHLENIRPGAGHPTGQPATTGRFRPLRTGRPGETRRTLRRRAAPRRTGHLPRCHLRFPPPRPRHRPVTCREYTATSCRTANDRHRKTAIVPIRQEHKHFQTEKKIIFRALSFQRTRRLTVDDSGTTSYPQPSAQFRPTGAHDILHDTQGSSPRFAPHVASSSDNAATISTDKIHSRTVFHYRPLPTKKTRETLWISLVK